MLQGCLDDPPSYSRPEQVAPFIIDAQVAPDVTAVVRIEAGVSQDLVVPFRSVDVGEDLEANLYLDRDPGQPGSWRRQQDVPAHPGRFEEDRPPVVMSFRPSTLDQPGCHTLTFILAHESQWDVVEVPEAPNPVPLPIDDTKAASVTWWLEIQGADGVPRRECPTSGETVP
jgi:hypothetical protein